MATLVAYTKDGDRPILRTEGDFEVAYEIAATLTNVTVAEYARGRATRSIEYDPIRKRFDHFYNEEVAEEIQEER